MNGGGAKNSMPPMKNSIGGGAGGLKIPKLDLAKLNQ